jgi:hypothetical protein
MSNQYMLSVKAQGFDAAIEGLQYTNNPYPASPEKEWWEMGMTSALWEGC